MGRRKKRRMGDAFWDAQPLGGMPDRELAGRIGCSVTAVRFQRHKRGIEAFGHPGRPPKGSSGLAGRNRGIRLDDLEWARLTGIARGRGLSIPDLLRAWIDEERRKP